jgi:hypothetical protein
LVPNLLALISYESNGGGGVERGETPASWRMPPKQNQAYAAEPRVLVRWYKWLCLSDIRTCGKE